MKPVDTDKCSVGNDASHSNLYDSEGEELEQKMYYDLYFSKQDDQPAQGKPSNETDAPECPPISNDESSSKVEEPSSNLSSSNLGLYPDILIDTDGSRSRKITYKTAEPQDKKADIPSKTVTPKSKSKSSSENKSSFLTDVIDKIKSTVSTSTPVNASRPIANRKQRSSLRSDFVMELSDSEDEKLIVTGSATPDLNLFCNVATSSSISFKNTLEMNHVNALVKGRARKRMRTEWPLDITEGREVQNRKGDVSHWTPHMNTFYDSDYSDDFDLGTVLANQSSEIVDWDLLREDLPGFFGSRRKDRRYFNGQRCATCRQFDHSTKNCPRVPVCMLCCSTSHTERFQCPDNICYRCGGNYHTFCSQTTAWVTCSICHQKGHTKELCPDIWRRYCYTTTGSEPVLPTSTKQEIPLCKLYCFHCAEAGHIARDCDFSGGKGGAHHILSVFPHSYELPVENVLGKDILIESEEREEEEEPNQYGECVKVYTNSRASVDIGTSKAGYIIGTKGATIKCLQRISGCDIDVRDDTKTRKTMVWIHGENIDKAIRTVLFLADMELSNLDGLRPYMEELAKAMGGRWSLILSYENKLKHLAKKHNKLNRDAKKRKLKDKRRREKKQMKEEESLVDISDEESVVYVSDDESDIEVLNSPWSNNNKSTKRSFDDSVTDNESEAYISEEDSKYVALSEKKLKRNEMLRRIPVHDLDPLVSSPCDTDEEFDSKKKLTKTEADFYNNFSEEKFHLKLPDAVLQRIKDNSTKLCVDYMSDFPDGRESAVEHVEEKLNELKGLKVNVEDVFERLKYNHRLYKSSKQGGYITQMEGDLKLLAKYFYGVKGCGYGKKAMKSTREILNKYKKSSAKYLAKKDKQKLVLNFISIFHADLSDFTEILKAAESLLINNVAKNKRTKKLVKSTKKVKSKKVEEEVIEDIEDDVGIPFSAFNDDDVVYIDTKLNNLRPSVKSRLSFSPQQIKGNKSKTPKRKKSVTPKNRKSVTPKRKKKFPNKTFQNLEEITEFNKSKGKRRRKNRS